MSARVSAPRRVAMLHGFLGSPESWGGVCAALGPHTEGVPLRLLGHGAERTEQSFEGEVTRLAATLDAQGLTHLVGYSLGARLALGVAARVRSPLRHLVLVSGRDGLASPALAQARCAHDDALAQTLETLGLPRFLEQWEAQPLFASQRSLDPALRAAHRARRLTHDPHALAASLRTLSLGRMPRYGAEAFARTARIDLVAGGLDDKFVTLLGELRDEHAPLRARAGLLPAVLHVIPGVGHDVLLERPAALATLLEEPS